MVWELAVLEIDPNRDAEFEHALHQAVPLFQRAHGCRGMQVQRSIEQPHRYRLIVDWDTLEDHVDGFRSSEDFARWRELVGPFFTRPPEVEHTSRLDLGFTSGT